MQRLVRSAVAIALVGAVVATPILTGTVPATAGAAPMSTRLSLMADGPVGHHGRWLTDSHGRVVLLHGVNLVAKGTESPAQRGFGDDDAAWLADNDFDVVRLGLVAADVMATPGVVDTAYLDSFQSTVNQLTARGLLVLVDLHQDGWGPTLGSDGFPDWMTLTHGATNTHTDFPLYYITNPAIQAAFESFWGNETGPGSVNLQDRVGAIFAALAGRFAANPNVLGYDLINEPWPGNSYSDCITPPGGCPTLDHGRLDPYYARMATAIRAEDPSHLVFGEPWVLFNFGRAPTNISLPGGDAQSGMSFHVYPLDPALEPTVLDYARTWSTATGGALLDSEFGATQDTTAVNRLVDETDAALIPWIWWSYDEEIVPDLNRPPGGANLRGPVTDALVRPHPVLVAGTPASLDYDEAAHTMTFSYSTASAGAALDDPTTEVEVPDRPYADGWHATVVGGRLTSAQGSSPATVVADAGASTVSITISPGAVPATTTSTVSTLSSTPVTSTPPVAPTTPTPVVTTGAVAVAAEPQFTG
jgi:endoglycosylceramidase